MTPKERVLAALNHVQPDRVPLDYLGTPEINALLLKHFRTQDMEVVLQGLGVDLRTVAPAYVGPPLPPGQDMWGVERRPVRNQAGTYDEPCNFPFRDMTTVEDVERYPWPSPDWFDFSVIPEQCRRYDEYAIVFGSMGVMDLINGIAFGRGVEQTILDIADENPVYLALAHKRFSFYLEYSRRGLEAGRGMIDVFFVGDDYGTQRGLLMSPAKWRKLFAPYLKQLIDLGHAYDCKAMLHSCGSTRALMDDFVAMGLDVYETVQPEADGMNPEELKDLYGGKLAFHGTISTQRTLPFGSPDDVRAEVRRRVEVVGRGGGLILAPAHNIQPDTPVENVLAMYDEGRSFVAAGA
ncbi:MAG: uroporphyrinogen decarboxylase family protein [Armatimonadota bacterium]